MTHEAITDRLLTLARERFGARAQTLSAGDDLYASLGIDSLQAMSLLTDVEDAFDVEIPDYEIADVRTLASIAGIVARRRGR
ncbi:MAG: hypothetical protein RLZZ383_1550 [Pseudomonadota bacterium]|jgi:acyl carrier protein